MIVLYPSMILVFCFSIKDYFIRPSLFFKHDFWNKEGWSLSRVEPKVNKPNINLKSYKRLVGSFHPIPEFLKIIHTSGVSFAGFLRQSEILILIEWSSWSTTRRRCGICRKKLSCQPSPKSWRVSTSFPPRLGAPPEIASRTRRNTRMRSSFSTEPFR